jgi:hypothetical protein
MSKASLLALADRIEGERASLNRDVARAGVNETNEDIAREIGVPLRTVVGHELLGNLRSVPSIVRDYVGSLDAAITVIPPGSFWTWIVSKEGMAMVTDMTPRVPVDHEGTPILALVPPPRYEATGCQSAARALCVAALRARASMEEA